MEANTRLKENDCAERLLIPKNVPDVVNLYRRMFVFNSLKVYVTNQTYSLLWYIPYGHCELLNMLPWQLYTNEYIHPW